MKAVASPLLPLLLILLHAMPTDAHDLHVATRLHLGHASHHPDTMKLRATLSSFARLAAAVGADRAVVAVDAEEKLEGYDLAGEVAQICNSLNGEEGNASSEIDGDAVTASASTGAEPLPPAPSPPLHVLPVRPWGKFVPALNAIVAHCARNGARRVLMASAEVQLTKEAMDVLHSHLDMESTLVVGAALPGHEYRARLDNEVEAEVALTGRTVPWNTCAVWNVPKLALTGFPLVAEGLHPAEDGGEGASGVEEACTIAALQRILTPERARAKLVAVPGTAWEQDFEGDEKRREWHERKMRSKFTRAQRQLELMGLDGTVIHC